MGCNTCKKEKATISEKVSQIDEKKLSFFQKFKKIILRIFTFCILLILVTPIVIVAYIITLFKVVFLSKGLNFVPILVLLGKKIMKLEEDDEDDYEDDEEINDEDYELENPDDIIVLK